MMERFSYCQSQQSTLLLLLLLTVICCILVIVLRNYCQHCRFNTPLNKLSLLWVLISFLMIHWHVYYSVGEDEIVVRIRPYQDEREHVGYGGASAIAFLKQVVDTAENHLRIKRLSFLDPNDDTCTKRWDLLWTFGPQVDALPQHSNNPYDCDVTVAPMGSCRERNERGALQNNYNQHHVATLLRGYGATPIMNHCFEDFVNNIAGTKSAQFKLYEGMKVSSEENMELYNFIPDSMALPRAQHILLSWLQKRTNYETEDANVWIFKPDKGRGGIGVTLHTMEELLSNLKLLHFLASSEGVLQRYIANPFLVEGYKHHLRIYFVTTSTYPLQAYVFNEGLYLPSLQPYSRVNYRNMDVHLTNSGRRKAEPDECNNETRDDAAFHHTCPQRLSEYWKFLKEKQGISGNTLSTVQGAILDSLRLLQNTSPTVAKKEPMPACVRCFEIYGVDVLLTKETGNVLYVNVLEVNHAPELWTSTKLLNQHVHNELVAATFNLVMKPPTSKIVTSIVHKCWRFYLDGGGTGDVEMQTLLGLCAEQATASSLGTFLSVIHSKSQCDKNRKERNPTTSLLCCCSGFLYF
eukprot:m.24617 g.24617  ORF g.24617 m.24617 type:complete len:578 (+) comp5677_c0_seq1:140-1873(+)